MMNIYHTILAEGNGGAVKLCQKEAGVQSHELTNRNSIQGQVREQVCTTKRSSDFTGYGKCCGCVAKVHVLIRGDHFDMQLEKAAPRVAKFVVIKEESAEAIVAQYERRVRSCLWKQWRRPRTRIRELLKLGVSLRKAIRVGISRKGPWHLSRTMATQVGMTNKWLAEKGLICIKDRWVKIHYPATARFSS